MALVLALSGQGSALGGVPKQHPLLASDAAPPFDIWTGIYDSIHDRFGKDVSDDELFALCEKFWGVDMDRAVALQSAAGKQMIKRHPLNDRGDLGSKIGLKKSIESLGMLLYLRMAPFLVETDVVDEYLALHWATTIEAMHVAYEDDKEKANRAVQMSMATGLPHARIYHKKIPADGARFLKEYGNKGNDQCTKKTVLECYRESIRIEKGWERRKKDMNWTDDRLADLSGARGKET